MQEQHLAKAELDGSLGLPDGALKPTRRARGQASGPGAHEVATVSTRSMMTNGHPVRRRVKSK